MSETTTTRRCWSCGAEYKPVTVHSASGRGDARVPQHVRRDNDSETCVAGGLPEPNR